jgi:LAS superfamily LD-carboxypeptidase LdcB
VLSVVALAASGPASAAARPAGDAIASRSDQSASTTAAAAASVQGAAAPSDEPGEGASPADVTVAEDDVESAAAADVAATLEHLGEELKAQKTAASQAKQAADQAAAEVEALTGADGKGTAAGPADPLRLLTRLNDTATPALEPANVAAAREKLDDAKASSSDAASALKDAEAEHTAFLTSTQERVTADLADADALAKRDPETAAALRADAAGLSGTLQAIQRHGPGTSVAEAKAAAEKAAAEKAAAAKAKAEKAAADARARAAAEAERRRSMPLPDPAGSASGKLAAAWCSNGQRIVVDASKGRAVQRLIDVAHSHGLEICARSGFRPYAEQVALRRQNCGGSDYAIFQAPPSTCSPPTARPGTSNHEDGLAVDFSCGDGQPMTHASPCFRWLAAYAHIYGFYNLPSEPWHWSTTGS